MRFYKRDFGEYGVGMRFKLKVGNVFNVNFENFTSLLNHRYESLDNKKYNK